MDKGKRALRYWAELSKAFDSIVHEFLLAKIEAYGFSYETLKAMHNYFTDKKHRTNVNHSLHDSTTAEALIYSTFRSEIFSFLLKKMLMTQLHIQMVKML